MTEIHVRPLEPETDLAALADLLTAIRRNEGNLSPATAEELGPALAQPKFRRWVATKPGGDEAHRPDRAAVCAPDRCCAATSASSAGVAAARGVGPALSDLVEGKRG